MVTEPMQGPVALAIFWIWLGFIAAGAIAYLVYRQLRPRLNKARKPPPAPPMKYAEQLRQRMRKKPALLGTVPTDRPGAAPKPASTTK